MEKCGRKTKRFVMKKVWLTWYFLYYLTHFIVFFAEYLYFCFVKSLTISFIISEVKSKNVNVAINFFRWSLWRGWLSFRGVRPLKIAFWYFLLLHSFSIKLNCIALIDIYLFFGINCIVSNSFYFILFVITSFKFKY